MWGNGPETEMSWWSRDYLLHSVVTIGGRRGRFHFVLPGL